MKTLRIVLLSNDYAERAEARGACAEAVAWMRSARHMSLRAMWETCPDLSWLYWVEGDLGLSDGAIRRAHDLAWDSWRSGGGRLSEVAAYRSVMTFHVVEPGLRSWLGLPVRK